MKYPSDTAAIALTPLRPEQVRNAVRQALFDATVNGDIGTVQERLEHKSLKARNDALIARVKTAYANGSMSVTDLSRWCLRLAAGEEPDDILVDLGVP